MSFCRQPGMQRGSLRLVVVGMFILTGSPVCGSARSATWQCTTLDRKSLAPSTAVVWERLSDLNTVTGHPSNNTVMVCWINRQAV